jgi:hypothetical protein
MPAVMMKTIPTLAKLAIPKTPVAGKGYSTLPRSNSFKQQQDKLSLSTNSKQFQQNQKRSIQVKVPKTSDRQLHESFHGLLPRLLSLKNLFQEKGRQTFSELFLNDVIVTEQLFTGIRLYADLQNPLLLKYAFDVQDFFSGTKEAFLQTQKSITLLHLMKNDLMMDRRENYQIDEVHKHMLKAAVSPKLYKLLQLKLLQRIDPVSEASRDYIIDSESLKLKAIVMEHVETKLIEGDECNLTTGNIVDEHSLISYPVGSVLATIDVIFESEQLYENCEDPEKPLVKRIVHSNWKFQGCISGHAPLNWMVIAMQNRIKGSELVHN